MPSDQVFYLYHWVPSNLTGSILYPLNQLKTLYPALYAAKVTDYQGREEVMAARIPLLDCLWNDVLHFAPVHPARTQSALTAAGLPRKQRRYFEVDPVQMGFHAGNAVIFFHQRVDLNRFYLHPEDFAPFDPQALASLGEIPAATQAYYRETQRQGRRPLVYLYVPHILYKGTLDIRGLNIVEVY